MKPRRIIDIITAIIVIGLLIYTQVQIKECEPRIEIIEVETCMNQPIKILGTENINDSTGKIEELLNYS